MEYINKLPFVLSASMTIVIGLISYQGTDTMQKTYAEMAVSIVVFYVVGIIIKKTLIEIYKDIEKKNEERREQEKKSNENKKKKKSRGKKKY